MGRCDGHPYDYEFCRGIVVPVRVWGNGVVSQSNAFKWDYCEKAIEQDREVGYQVEEVETR